MKKEIRILLISSGYIGGEKKHLSQIIQQLSRHFLFTLIVPKVYKKKGDTNQSYSLSIKGLWSIVKVCRINHIDIIHCHGFKAIFAIGLLRSFVKLPLVIYTVHGFHSYWKKPSVLKWIRLKVEKWLIKKRDRTIVVSESDYDALMRFCNFKDKSIQLIKNGIELDQSKKEVPRSYQSIGVTPNIHQLFVSIGKIDEVKGYDLVIRAASELLSEKRLFKWVVVGGGRSLNKYQQKVQKMGLENNLFFIGHDNTPLNWLSVANLYVSTSYWEGSPYSVLEAMAHKVPVIAPDVPGCRDLIQHNKTGILYDRSCLESFIRHLREFIDSPQSWTPLAFEGINQLESQYSVEKMIKELEAVYRSEM